ncbi:XRE family transcriptional regulator [Neomegalonema sp.]|uniref:helix-turn-helix domain-containing protein n=1 Tax=Neomegalonema sp. TaxID=2039713 RepID=UPI0026298865|nr:XRE family transcriptional regulator [Neomegalonema sp.]MDD2868295.1 XRE family transcriptional regulator [Neomegalonema sp.]
MNIISDDPEARLARRIRLEREARGWSLADLARASEVSKAAISKIERGEVSPTAGVLLRLATAFGLTLAGLLLRAEGDSSRLARLEDQPLWRDPETGYLRRQIFHRPDHPLEMVETTLPPGARVVLPASSHVRIRQILRVVSGRLSLTEGGETHDLGPGDRLAFGAPAETTFHNAAAEPCVYLVILVRS